MEPYPLRELVDLAVVDAWFLPAAIVIPVAFFIASAVVGARRRQVGGYLVRWGFPGLTAPLAFGLWKFFLYTVRYDPLTGRSGLHQLRILGLDALVFIAVGVLWGYLYARLVSRVSARKL